MKTYNADLIRELLPEEIDLENGKLSSGKIITNIEENEFQTPIEEDVLVYTPFTDEEIVEKLRFERQMQCFEIINRGEMFWTKLWQKYSFEEIEQMKQELENWYNEWLDVTYTRVIPIKPYWLI